MAQEEVVPPAKDGGMEDYDGKRFRQIFNSYL